MRRLSLFLFAAATLASFAPASAQQSKWEKREAVCAREKVPSVREVCRDRHLTRLDSEMNEIYRDLRTKLSRTDFADVRLEQKSWLRQRNRCGSRYRCIKTRYEDRLAVLAQLLENIDNPGTSHVERGRSPSKCAAERRLRSRNSSLPTVVTFRNRAQSEEDSFKIYWIDFKGRRKLYATVFKGQTHRQQTFMTHPWVITSPEPGGGEICIGVYMPDAQPRVITLR